MEEGKCEEETRRKIAKVRVTSAIVYLKNKLPVHCSQSTHGKAV